MEGIYQVQRHTQGPKAMMENLWHTIKLILLIGIPVSFAVYVFVDYLDIKEIVIKWKIK